MAIRPEPVCDYVLRLRPVWQEGHNAPPAVRLRRLLKYALRACGLKCVEHREVSTKETSRDGTAQED